VIGFVGLGHMGGAIVRRLLREGADVLVFDVNEEAVADAVRRGARAAPSARAVADAAPLVMACLPSVAVSKAVAGEIAGGAAIAVYAELSTIGREAIAAVEAILRPAGVAVVDAPVSGGPIGAEQGTLSVMLAGEAGAVDLVAAAAAPFAGAIIRLGDQAGQAQLCKLVNNGIGMTALLVSCEAIAVGAAAGIDPAILVEIVNAGTGRNSATVQKLPRYILPRDFSMGAPLGSALKDLDLYLAEAEAAGLEPGVIAETRALWARATDALDPHGDAATVVRYFEGLVGAEVKAA